MTEKKEFQVNKNTPFWDASLTDQERIDWLLKEMTVEEKLGYLASSSPDLPRLGIPGADRYECILGPGADQTGR